jgi:hypothetical protein
MRRNRKSLYSPTGGIEPEVLNMLYGTQDTDMSYQIPKPIRTAIMAEAGPLAHVVDNAINQSFRTAWLKCGHRPGEVDLVLSFFIEGLDFLEEEFNRLLKPRGVAVCISGIFTHQTPMVELTTTEFAGRRCELSDLCVLTTYGQPLATRGLGNAMLLQAKMEVRYGGLDEIQQALYADETRFDYHSPGALRTLNPRRRVLPPKYEPALAFWDLGGRHFPELPDWDWHRTNVMWGSQMHRECPTEHEFGAMFVDFLRGAAGYGLRQPGVGEIRWNRIIFDLLEVTAKAAVTRRNLAVRDVPRGSDRTARRLLKNANGPGCPFVLRNSLAETLAFYSPELGELGKKIELTERVHIDDEQPLDEHEPKRERDGGLPPILGDERLSEGDGGAGNLVFFHFTEATMTRPTGRKFSFD